MNSCTDLTEEKQYENGVGGGSGINMDGVTDTIQLMPVGNMLYLPSLVIAQ
jgi:hypothetical protein